MRLNLLLFLLGLVAHGMCDNWALLVAGSNGWWNYRHQADVCHAYQILHKNGFPDDRIVVMMYDDIATNSENPNKGTIINRPNGPNVYDGVPKDYTGTDVNPTNFLNVLSGKADAMKNIGSGKVIQSGPNDKVFVFFSDHGSTNLIAFPNDYLYADSLISTLKEMHTNQQYQELIFYLEACESGSMFNGLLPEGINIYTTTAADPCQSSYACYYDEVLQTYLGDCYSVSWMENTEKVNDQKESFEKQYQIIKSETNQSIVCQYGQIDIAYQKLSQFFFGQTDIQDLDNETLLLDDYPRHPVDQRDVELRVLSNKLRVLQDEEEKLNVQAQIKNILHKRRRYDELFWNVAKDNLGGNFEEKLKVKPQHNGYEDNIDVNNCISCESYEPTKDMNCLRSTLDGIEEFCGKFDHYGLYYTKWISRMCNYGIEPMDMITSAHIFCFENRINYIF